MFEKEAEEYALGWREKTDGTYACCRDGYLAGAEFGYKKGFEECAKARLNVTTISDCPIKDEWHYVKDGDLPKVGVQVLSEQGTLVIYKGEGFNWVEYSPNADNIKLRKWEEPIAWKEIVLPELPKESE